MAQEVERLVQRVFQRHPLAYAGLAEGYAPLVIYSHLPPKDAFPKPRAAAHRALEAILLPGLLKHRSVQQPRSMNDTQHKDCCRGNSKADAVIAHS